MKCTWVVAGPAAELEPLLAKLRAEEVFVRELDTLGIAYHSPSLRAYGEDLAAGKYNNPLLQASSPRRS